MGIELRLACATHTGDIDSLCSWLATYPKLTKGELTVQLERRFCEMTGCEQAVFVNSGSSANLLMLSALKSMGVLHKGHRVGVPSVCWATDIAPIIQLGLVPVVLDCDYSLNIDPYRIECCINEHDIRALINVSVLGIPGKSAMIRDICEDSGTVYLEDNCESFGTEIERVPLGASAIMSSWSTYYGHHISTIEGGFVGCNDADTYEVLLMLRSHGWTRDLSLSRQSELQDEYGIDDFNMKYRFFELGYNVRNTEIGAFLGLKQLERAPEMRRVRERNYRYFCSKMNEWHTDENPAFAHMYEVWFDDKVPSFALPVIRQNRQLYVDRLARASVECRPLIAGAIQNHPLARKYTILNKESCPNSEIVDREAFYLPNHIEIDLDDIDMMVATMKGHQ